MGRWGRIVGLAVGGLLTMATGAAAQVCGDADASGAVTVTDGVQALRAAAGLSSACAGGRCDLDGSGAVTVSDGVNVLRKAAGLDAPDACPAGSATEVVGSVLGEMTKIARVPAAAAALAAARAAMVGPADAVPCDEGFLESEGNTTTFTDCRFGALLLNGKVTSVTDVSDPERGRFVRTDVYEAYEVRLLDSGFTFRQDGTSTVDIDTQAGRLVENATLRIFVDDSAFGRDEYTLTKVDLTTDTQTGAVLTGKLVSALAEAGLVGLKSVGLGFVTGTLADVDVEFDDGRVERFTYDLVTADLTPASAAFLARGGALAAVGAGGRIVAVPARARAAAEPARVRAAGEPPPRAPRRG